MNRCTRFLLVMSVLLAACSSAPQQHRAVTGSGVHDRRNVVEQDYAAALELMNRGDEQGAKRAFSAMAKQHPGLSGPWTNLGILHARAGDDEQALSHFRQALNSNPRNVVAMNWMGYLHSQRGDVDSARKWYSTALSVRQDYAPAHLNLAILYDTELHRAHDAIRHYRRYQELVGSDNLAVSAWIRELEDSVEHVAAVDGEDAR